MCWNTTVEKHILNNSYWLWLIHRSRDGVRTNVRLIAMFIGVWFAWGGFGLMLAPMLVAGPFHWKQVPPPPQRNGRMIAVRTVPALEEALRDAHPGDTIVLEEGIYTLDRTLWIVDKTHVTLCGRSRDPSKTILKGKGWGKPSDDYRTIANQDLLVIRSSQDILIANLTFADGAHYGIRIGADNDLSAPNPGGIHIYNCYFRDIATRAIKGVAMANRKPVSGGSVRFCVFENTKVPDPSWSWAIYGGNYISSIDMMYLEAWNFSDNLFLNIKGATGGGRGAIFVWNQSRNIVVERNVFVGCDRAIAFGNPSKPTGYQEGTLHVYDGIIRNNFIIVGANPHTTGVKGIEIVWVDNVQVHHNSIYAPDLQYRGIHFFQKIHRLHVANNLVRGRIDGEGDASLNGNVTGMLEGCFVNPQEGDLHLTEHATEALAKGVFLPAVKEDIDGERRRDPPEVGADERIIGAR